jgi:hypothetical protein
MSARTEDFPEAENSGVDRLLKAVSLTGLAVLLFLAGVLASILGVFPADLVRDGYNGGAAVYARWTRFDDITKTDLWFPARTDGRGVTEYDDARSQPGLTLYSSGHEAAAILLSADGSVVHTWRRPYSTVWSEESPVRNPLPDGNVYFRRLKAFANGDLLAIYEGAGDTPYGYGMVRLDRNSEVLWSYFGHTHHDFDVGPDGRIYALTHENRTRPLEGLEHLDDTRLDDFLDVLSPDGELLKRVSLIETVAGSRFRHLLYNVPAPSIADPLHTNTIKVLTPAMARALPGTEPGQVLLSFRDIGAVAVLDLEAERIVWAMRGPWYGQHDPDVLANGNLLVFDNLGGFPGPGGQSRVLEVDPRTAEIVWRYAGTERRPFDSDIRSDQQRLANGNTLINESNGGRIFEVTPSGDVVWEFVNPVRIGERDRWIPIVASAERLDPDFFARGVVRVGNRGAGNRAEQDR